MNCEICGNEGYDLITNKTRDGGGSIVRCSNCGLVYQLCDKDNNELQQYYNTEYCETNSLDCNRLLSPEEHYNSSISTKGPYADDIKKIISKFDYKPDILELGASTGELLQLLSGDSNKLVGIEINDSFCKWGNDNLADNIHLISKDILELDIQDKFDIIVCNHTLEHFIHPFDVVKKSYHLLKDNGFVYMTVPNIDEALNNYAGPETQGCYQTFFWHKAHLFYFSESTLRSIFEKAGFKVERIYSFHEYTFRNFLQWYFVGKPGKKFDEEINDTGLFKGESIFEKEINNMMAEMDRRFKEILFKTKTGSNLAIIAKKG